MASSGSGSLSIEESIKAEGIRLGFSLVGITTPEPPTSYPTYLDWIDKNHHAAMAWMATDRALHLRQNPIGLLPECQSVLVLAARYPLSWSPQPALAGRIAGYARHADYHKVFIKALKRLIDFIQTLTAEPVFSKAYTDTGPILEKEMAKHAGLGWIGKNSLLISPTHGSNLLLAELFLTLKLNPDSPFTFDRCGSCERCVQACPTGCILPNRTIDARKCISYLTIENKEPIPEDLMRKQSGWAFGCDICQQVCPWNQRLIDVPSSRLFETPSPEFLSLKTGLMLTDESFTNAYAHTPVSRTRSDGLRRNLLSLAATQVVGDDIVMMIIGDMMGNPNPIIRQQAALSLASCLGPNCLPYLRKAIEQELDPDCQNELKRLIQQVSGQPLG